MTHKCSCGPLSWLLGKSGSEGKSARRSTFSRRYGFALGLFRGATPCAKIVLLAPLIIATPLPGSLLIVAVFALVSTLYPIIGILSVRLVGNIKRARPVMRMAGAIIVLAIGVYSLIKFTYLDSCSMRL
jgi:hypothetical protein